MTAGRARKARSPGRVLIVSGPSGSGKTTLSEKLLRSRTFGRRIVRSISATTRPRRPGERQGRDYFFLSERMFLYKVRAGHFLEHEKVFRHYYGTPVKPVREQLRRGMHVLLCIDVKGARVVRRKVPDALSIFIRPPGMADLRRRLTGRATESRRDLDLRLKTAREEMKDAGRYDHVIVNDHLAAAYRELEAVVGRELFG